MKERFLIAWGRDGKDYSPMFRPCGAVMQNTQFSWRNITGKGSSNRVGALINWFKQVYHFVLWGELRW